MAFGGENGRFTWEEETVQDGIGSFGIFFLLKSMVALVLAQNIPNRQTLPSLVSESFHQHPA